MYAYNNRISGERKIGAVELTLIKVADQRLGDTERDRTAEGLQAIYCSRVRTLVDAVYDWSRFDSLLRGFGPGSDDSRPYRDSFAGVRM